MARNLKHGRKAYVAYVACLMVILLLPLVGMAFTDSSDTLADAEKRDLATWPTLVKEDGAPNEEYLGDLGAYFEDHFAFRDTLITANSLMKRATVGSNPGDEVIMGKDGWLYYRGTLRDYLGRENMNGRELFDLAHNMRLIQDYATQNGARFAFVVVPNKNTLYPQNMPEHYVAGASHNMENVRQYLDAAGVNWVDTGQELAGQEGLYFERDNHWNGKGALVGYNATMEALGREHETFEDVPLKEVADHTCDLEQMAFPTMCEPVVDWYPDTDPGYEIDGDEDADVARLTSMCPTGQGTLVMYRDSFAKMMIRYLSRAFENAHYMRMTPYDIGAALDLGATDVVVEIVERNLLDLLSRPAVFPSPQAAAVEGFQDMTASASPDRTRLRAQRDGAYLMVSGTLDPALVADDADLVIEIDGVAYTPFYTSNADRSGTSFYVCVPRADGGPVQVRAFVLGNGESILAAQGDIEIEAE